jgi:GH35 family endo-1,4-beta-xylanase
LFYVGETATCTIMAEERRRRRPVKIVVAVILVTACLAGFIMLDHISLLVLGLWVRQFPHATIEIAAFDADGRRMGAVEFFRTWRPALFVRDSDGCASFGMQYGVGDVRIAVPLNEAVKLEMLWPVPGFGRVLVSADNHGEGYAAAAGKPLRLELIPEFARTHLSRVERWVRDRNQGLFASDEAARETDTGHSLLRQAFESPDSKRRTKLALDALRFALSAGEHEVLAEARDHIPQARYGTLIVVVHNAAGRGIPNTRIILSEAHPDFLFGVFSDGYDKESVARLKSLDLNYAEVSMPWERLEPQPGQFTFNSFNRLFNLDLLRKNDFTLYAHALVWLADSAVPPYVQAQRGRTAQLVAATREHTREIIEHYKNQVQIWETIDEGHTAWSRLGLDDDGVALVAKAASAEIRKHSPHSSIAVEVTLPLAEDVSLKHYPFIRLLSSGRIGSESEDPYEFLRRLANDGVNYDILGLQFYNGAWVHVAGGMVQVPAIDLLRFACELARYEKFGKPMQIAEFSIGSSHFGSSWESWWHARANTETQSDYLAGIWTIAYAEPQINGINWWGLYDKYRAVEDGGLYDQLLRPKPSANRLAELIRGWRTDGELVTGTNGTATFSGAAGDYDIKVQTTDFGVNVRTHISRGETRTLEVVAKPRRH